MLHSCIPSFLWFTWFRCHIHALHHSSGSLDSCIPSFGPLDLGITFTHSITWFSWFRYHIHTFHHFSGSFELGITFTHSIIISSPPSGLKQIGKKAFLSCFFETALSWYIIFHTHTHTHTTTFHPHYFETYLHKWWTQSSSACTPPGRQCPQIEYL